MENQTKIKIVCASCGSEDVRRNADCVWDVDHQEWEVVSLFDTFSCGDCEDSDASVEEEEVA